MKILNKYYPFWLGLIVCIGMIYFNQDLQTAVLLAYIFGYFDMFNFSKKKS